MSGAADIDAQVSQEIRALLAGVDACGPAGSSPGWASADQIRFVRLFVEKGLDELEQVEDDLLEFLSICAQLAGENMQDARLWSLEREVDELKNPTITLQEMLMDAAILLAGELLIVGGFSYAVPGLLILLKNRSVAKAARKLAQVVEAEGTQVAQLSKFAKSTLEKERELLRLGSDLRRSTTGWADVILTNRLRGVKRELKQLADDQVLGRAALETSQQAAERALAARDAASKGAKLANEQLDGFLTNVVSDTVVGRAGEQSGPNVEAVIAQMASAGEGAGRPPFETSSIVGDLLAAIQQERVAARLEWGDLRLHVRFLTDAQFLQSIRVQVLLRKTCAHRPLLAQNQMLAPTVRSAFVNSFEVLLWHSWFVYNEMLGVATGQEVVGSTILLPGQVFAGAFITNSKGYVPKPSKSGDLVPVNAKYFATGDYYPAIPKLNDDLTEYLYRKFARGYFIRHPKSLPEPLTFAAARYDEVPAMPNESYVVFTNADRAKRLDEMRLMVAIYFNGAPEMADDGIAEPVRKLMRVLLGFDPNRDVLKEWLDLQMEPPVPEPLPGFQGPLADLAAPVGAMLRDTGIERTWLVGDARSQLETAITDLDLKISLYPLEQAPATPEPEPDDVAATVRKRSSAPAVGADTAADAVTEIEEMQKSLATRYAQFKKLAVDQAAVITEVQELLGARIDELTTWAPDRDADLAWRWPAG